MGKEYLYRGRFLSMVRRGRWEYCERVNCSGAVMIFAMTPQQEVILAEEYRPPIDGRCICFPAGLCGDAGTEEEVDAARRELKEESGYEAEEMRFLFRGPSSPGLTSETLSFYLASGLRRVDDGGGIDGENIRVHKIPLEEVERWLQQQTSLGVVIDPRVYTGLYFLHMSRS